jgi:phthiocerol/phenolphthiocerol synthesis type-I polyketide synthase E
MEPIAIIGMACRFPGAGDIEEFWRNLVAGRESIMFFTPDQLRATGVRQAVIDDPAYVAARPVMKDPEYFDAALFGMTSREAELCDPQIRVFLEVCHGAVENAGYDPFATGDGVGVFGTVGRNDYLARNLRTNPARAGGSANAHLVQTLNEADYSSTTVSYRLDLSGPSMTVNTACSSALTAVHMACQALRYGECDAALAGGAVIEIPPGRGYTWIPGSVHSANGHCRPFSTEATGTIFGSGAGAVLLKRMSDALAAGDHIKAVIRASAVNNDGADKVSFSAPSVTGQTAAVIEAMVLAKTLPAEVGYVEAHATGTALGDPVEIAALNDAYQRLTDVPLSAGSTLVGSVKSNIGHLNQAAGIAGLIKTVLILEREAVPPTIGVGTLNPQLALDRTPFAVNTELRPWPRQGNRTRVAGVTSLGIGGTNVHAVVQEGPPPEHAPTDGDHRIIAWSGQSEAARGQARGAIAEFFATDPPFADAAGTLLHGRTPHAFRAVTVCTSAAEASEILAGANGGRIITGEARPDVQVGFLFPGQGASRPLMAAGLYGTVRSFTVVMDECLEAFEREGLSLSEAWLDPEHARTPPSLATQPLIFAVEYALATMWISCGQRPAALLGHSIGELAAAAVAGVFGLSDAARIVAARATAMHEHPVPGGMLAVAGPESAVAELLTSRLAVAAINGPRQTVVSGPNEDLGKLAEQLADTGLIARRLEVAYAFHHPEWAAAEKRFRQAFAGVPMAEPRIPLYSGATGAQVSAGQATDPEFWITQMSRRVLFLPALRALLAGQFAGRHGALLEAGPGRTLSQLVKPVVEASADVGEVTAVAALAGDGDELAGVLKAAGRLWTVGAAVDWTALNQHEPQTRLPLPGYPYQRRRHWIDPADPAQQASAGAAVAARARTEQAASAAAVTPLSVLEWTRTSPCASRPGQDGTALVMLPADKAAAAAVLRAVQRTGARAIRVVPDAEYAADGDRFRVRLGDAGDFARVWNTLHDRGIKPGLLVHGVTSAAWETTGTAALGGQLAAAYYSLQAMAKAALLLPAGQEPRLLVVTTRSVDVTGGERVDPVKAIVHGLLRTALSEAPRLTGRVIDVGDRVPAAILATELAAPAQRGIVALRGRHRWIAAERPMPVPAAVGEALRENGVYLITGAFGGLGRVLSRRLATTGLCPRLIMLGRTGGDGSRDAVAELTALGADVHAAACDITDAAALRAAVSLATSRFGAVNGIFHLAGKPGGRMIAFREDTDAAAVLAPKVTGTLNLEEVFADAPRLDFVVYYSSRAGADGLVGGADYAAANAFLDAMPGESNLAGGQVLSVGWPVFSGVGMAVNSGYDIGSLAGQVAQISRGALTRGPAAPEVTAPEAAADDEATSWETDLHAATHWVLDEHRVNRIPLLPGTAYLDVLVRAFRERVTPRQQGAIVMEEVVFLEPFYDTKSRRMRLSFRARGAVHEFTMASRPSEDPSAPWVVHATGRIARSAAARPTVDLAALRARIEAASADAGGKPVKSAFTLGPRWRNLVAQWTAGDERLAVAELPAPFRSDLAEHAMHPALLDTMTALIRRPGQASTVPFLYRRLVHHGDLPGKIFGHIRRLESVRADTVSGDIDLIDSDGNVLVSITGFTMRDVDLATAWTPGAAVAARDAAAAPDGAAAVDGLDPEAGAGLLLALLCARATGHILVRPHRDGVPVPMPAERPPRTDTEPTADTAAGETAAGETAAGDAAKATGRPPQSGAPPAGSSLEERLRQLWAEVLGVSSVTDDQDFFDAGGHSLTAIEIVARARDMFGVELSIGLLLDTRTFGGLVRVLREQGAK